MHSVRSHRTSTGARRLGAVAALVLTFGMLVACGGTPPPSSACIGPVDAEVEGVESNNTIATAATGVFAGNAACNDHTAGAGDVDVFALPAQTDPGVILALCTHVTGTPSGSSTLTLLDAAGNPVADATTTCQGTSSGALLIGAVASGQHFLRLSHSSGAVTTEVNALFGAEPTDVDPQTINPTQELIGSVGPGDLTDTLTAAMPDGTLTIRFLCGTPLAFTVTGTTAGNPVTTNHTCDDSGALPPVDFDDGTTVTIVVSAPNSPTARSAYVFSVTENA